MKQGKATDSLVNQNEYKERLAASDGEAAEGITMPGWVADIGT
jgi:hypothetical protein